MSLEFLAQHHALITHHPSEATLIAYASGSLGEPVAVVVATHLLACPVCRAMASLAEMVGGVMFEQSPASALAGDALDRLFAKLDRPELTAADPAPAPPDNPWPSTLSAYRIGRWRPLSPGIRRIPLKDEDDSRLDLLRVAPGTALPPVDGEGLVLSCVLGGFFRTAVGRFGPGDLAEADASVERRAVAEGGQDCIVLVAVESGAEPAGIKARLMQPQAE
jgi:putative transcriptional regulator